MFRTKIQTTIDTVLKLYDITWQHVSPHIREKYIRSSPITFLPPPQQQHGKSPWEPKIIEYLKRAGVRYEYERSLLITSARDGTFHFRYPDFYLPEHNLYLECNGGENRSKWQAQKYLAKSMDYELNKIPYEIIHERELYSGAWALKLDRVVGEKLPTHFVRNTYGRRRYA